MATKTATFNGEVLLASSSDLIYDAGGFTGVVVDFSALSSLTFSLHDPVLGITGEVGSAGPGLFSLVGIYAVIGASVDDTFSVSSGNTFTIFASEGDDSYDMNSLSKLSYADYASGLTFDLDSLLVSGKAGGHVDSLVSLPGILVGTNHDDTAYVSPTNTLNSYDGGGNDAGGDLLSWDYFTGGATVDLATASGDGVLNIKNVEVFQGSAVDDVFSAASGGLITSFTILATEGGDTYDLGGQGTLTYAAYGNALTFDLEAGTVSGKVGGQVDSLPSLPNKLVATAFDDVVYLSTSATIGAVDGGAHVSLGDLLSWDYFIGGATVDLAAASGDGVLSISNFELFQGSGVDDVFSATAAGLITGFTILATEGGDTYDLGGQGTLTYAGYATGLTFDMDAAGAVVVGKAGSAVDSLLSLPGELVLTGHDDTFLVDATNPISRVDAGAGIDTLSFERVVTGALVDFSTGLASGITESFSNFERALGSAGDDTFIASSVHQMSFLDGGDGTDLLSFAGVTGGATVNLDAHTGTGIGTTFANFEAYQGSAAADSFSATTATGFTVLGSLGGDSYALHGHGTLSYAGMYSPLTFTLGTSTSTVTGKADSSSDVISGALPKVVGSDGNDLFLPAASGNETLDGGGGFDTLQLSGLRSSWSIINNHDGSGSVHKGTQTITFSHMEQLKFDNATVSSGFTVEDDMYGTGRSATFWRAADGEVWTWNNHDTGSDAYDGHLGVIPLTWNVAGIGDLSGDGKADVIWHNSDGQVWYWYMDGGNLLEQGSVTIAGTPVYLDPTIWHGLGSRDFDGDGHHDLLWQSSVDGTVYEWSMNGNAVIDQGTVGQMSSGFSVLGYGDVNGDAKTDVTWYNASTNQVEFWFMNGHTKTIKDVTIDPSYTLKGVGDFNGDGTADLVGVDATGDVSIFFTGRNGSGVGTGNIVSVETVGNASSVFDIKQVNDYNGDGYADILFIANTATTPYGADVWVWEMNGSTIIDQGSAGTIDLTVNWTLYS